MGPKPKNILQILKEKKQNTKVTSPEISITWKNMAKDAMKSSTPTNKMKNTMALGIMMCFRKAQDSKKMKMESMKASLSKILWKMMMRGYSKPKLSKLSQANGKLICWLQVKWNVKISNMRENLTLRTNNTARV